MLNKIFIASFVFTLLFSGIIGGVIFYHFKKFSLTGDAFARKIVMIFFFGMAGISLFALLFLLFATL